MKRPVIADLAKNLSRREKQVFSLLGEGKSAAEIRSRLRLGTKTVENYRFRLKQKLGVTNIYQLVRLAVLWRERVLPRPPLMRNASAAAHRLSPREKQVLGLIGQGKRAIEVATQLRLSRNTVQEYCTRAKQKLGAANIYQLVRMAVVWRETMLANRAEIFPSSCGQIKRTHSR